MTSYTMPQDDEAILEGTGYSWGRCPQYHDGEYNSDFRRVLIVSGRTWRYEPENCQGGLWDEQRGTFDTEWHCIWKITFVWYNYF